MEAEGEQKAARRLVKVRKRKVRIISSKSLKVHKRKHTDTPQILPGHSIIVTRGIDKENAVLKVRLCLVLL